MPSDLAADPHDIFADWLADQDAAGRGGRVLMTLATAGADGRPSARMMLLKEYDRHGCLFYTDLRSRKAADLRANPYAALVLYFPDLRRQLRIEGGIEEAEASEADQQFASLPGPAQIAAWASDQSAPLESADLLTDRFGRISARYGDAPVPRPPHWAVLRVKADRFEFWEEQRQRLHTRRLFERDGAGWRAVLLNP